MERVIPLVSAHGLAIGHRGRLLIRDIDLRLDLGRVLCVLGPNGAGKTTLFRTLLGHVPPLAGRIALGDRPLDRMPRSEIARHLAHVPQALASPFAFTALDVVLMGASVGLGLFQRPGKAEAARAFAALDQLGIAELAPCDVTRLSGGQRQLVLIARALAQDAAAIILDEPTASLDFANRIRVTKAIRQLADSGIGVIMSSHDPDQAAATGDHALLIGHGGVIASGAAAETLNTENLSRLYGIPVRSEPGPDGKMRFC